ncbi:MAG: hypothetical protein JSS97_07270 [Actinobacteria bacterium]|nr:hypothetical protein [Actinomycetota bacterium]
MRSRRVALILTAALLALGATGLTATALAGAPPKPVTSNSVPVSGAAVTKVTVRAAVKDNRLTVTLVPGHYPFAKKAVSLKGKVSDWSASVIKVRIKATGPREGTGTLTVTGPLNQVQPDVAVYSIAWRVGTSNSGTLKLTAEGH